MPWHPRPTWLRRDVVRCAQMFEKIGAIEDVIFQRRKADEARQEERKKARSAIVFAPMAGTAEQRYSSGVALIRGLKHP